MTEKKASALDLITTGIVYSPPRVLLYSEEGVGKSTFAAGAPSPIFIQTEDGLDAIASPKFPLAKTFDDVMSYLLTLANDDHNYETVVVDTLDQVQILMSDKLCLEHGVESVDQIAGGWGKWKAPAIKQWRDLLDALGYLRSHRKMAIVLLAHAEVQPFADPELPPYDRWVPRLHKHAVELVCDWCDAVLFAHCRFRVAAADTGFGKKRVTAHAVGKAGGDRIIRPVGGPACVAKNRYGLTKEIPLDWDAFASAMAGGEA